VIRITAPGASAPPEPTLGPSGMQSRWNWLAKNRETNRRNHFRISLNAYCEPKLCGHSRAMRRGPEPKRKK